MHMNKIYPLFVLIFTASFVYAQQDSVANAGMENWGPNPNYDDLLDWTTLNPSGVLLNTTFAFKTTDAAELHSGDHAVKLVTQNLDFFGVTPSILTNGEINTTTQTTEGGVEINSRPSGFGGWFRFDPVNMDSTAFVEITLTKWNSSTGMSEDVGTGSMGVYNTSGAFENLEVEIEYLSMDIPDTVFILIGSGTPDGEVGSALFVDDLYYNYPNSVETPESVGLGLYPNPTNDVLNISSLKGVSFTSATVYSTDGRIVSSSALTTSSEARLDVSELKPGVYIVELRNNEGTVVRQQFLKK